MKLSGVIIGFHIIINEPHKTIFSSCDGGKREAYKNMTKVSLWVFH